MDLLVVIHGKRLTDILEKVYNVQFMGLTPVENTGQVVCQGDSLEEDLESLKEYLTEIYGPKNFKIIYFTEAEGLDPDSEPVEIPIVFNPPKNRVLN